MKQRQEKKNLKTAQAKKQKLILEMLKTAEGREKLAMAMYRPIRNRLDRARMKQLLSIAVVLMMAMVSCKSMPPMPIEPTGTSSCQAACDRMKMLHCPEGEDLPDGTTCMAFCIETQERGHSLNPQCLKAIDTCEEIYTKCGQ